MPTPFDTRCSNPSTHPVRRAPCVPLYDTLRFFPHIHTRPATPSATDFCHSKNLKEVSNPQLPNPILFNGEQSFKEEKNI